MASMSETPCLRLKPCVVRLIRRSDERKRATETIDHFLIVSQVTRDSVSSPFPSRRQLPACDVCGQRSNYAHSADGRLAR
jgi:hypothetical protein